MVHVVSYGVLSLITLSLCKNFTVPPVHLEAYFPKGFKAYIEDQAGLKQFIFNGKKNEYFRSSETGEIYGEVKTPTDGKWVYSDPNLELSVGDVIRYWIFVQHGRLGYQKDNNSWNVTELINNECETTTTTISDGQACAGKIFFEDDFTDSSIDESKWTIEQYIPLSQNAEFVVYRKSPETTFIRNSNLYLKPEPHDNIIGTLDITSGCTRTGRFYLPPVNSGKIKTKKAFKYGKIEIRAKLPAGDWIYPQIELIPSQSSCDYRKLLIAYARGNEWLTLKNGFDIGATLLFGVIWSKGLPSRRFTSPVTKNSHIFSLTWSPEKIVLTIDNEEFGSVSSNVYSGFDQMFYLTLGVGVGGNYEFPDSVESGSFVKPWINDDINQIYNFYKSKANWENTWHGDDTALIVDYVRIWAL